MSKVRFRFRFLGRYFLYNKIVSYFIKKGYFFTKWNIKYYNDWKQNLILFIIKCTQKIYKKWSAKLNCTIKQSASSSLSKIFMLHRLWTILRRSGSESRRFRGRCFRTLGKRLKRMILKYFFIITKSKGFQHSVMSCSIWIKEAVLWITVDY